MSQQMTLLDVMEPVQPLAPPPTPVEEQLAQRPAVTPDDVEAFVEFLRGRGWMYRRDIHRERPGNERALRQLAEESSGRVLGGQRGYRLTAEATQDEVDEVVGFLTAQADKMAARSDAIQNFRFRTVLWATNRSAP